MTISNMRVDLPNTGSSMRPEGRQLLARLTFVMMAVLLSLSLVSPTLAQGADMDNDGLSNREENWYGTDPKVADPDGDGLLDGWEVNTFFTKPLMADTDGDGLSDGDEYLHSLSPLHPDTDYDGLSDSDELNVYFTDPHLQDTDSDGLRDRDELGHQTDPLVGDTDGDGRWDGQDSYPLDPSYP